MAEQQVTAWRKTKNGLSDNSSLVFPCREASWQRRKPRDLSESNKWKSNTSFKDTADKFLCQKVIFLAIRKFQPHVCRELCKSPLFSSLILLHNCRPVVNKRFESSRRVFENNREFWQWRRQSQGKRHLVWKSKFVDDPVIFELTTDEARDNWTATRAVQANEEN